MLKPWSKPGHLYAAKRGLSACVCRLFVAVRCGQGHLLCLCLFVSPSHMHIPPIAPRSGDLCTYSRRFAPLLLQSLSSLCVSVELHEHDWTDTFTLFARMGTKRHEDTRVVNVKMYAKRLYAKRLHAKREIHRTRMHIACTTHHDMTCLHTCIISRYIHLYILHMLQFFTGQERLGCRHGKEMPPRP